MDETELAKLKMNLIDSLVQLRQIVPYTSMFVYRGAADFVLRHGVWYDPTCLRPEETPEGLPRKCYANAIVLCAIHPTWRYVEGFAVSPVTDMPIMHAWNVTPSALMVDCTWRNSGLIYFGVEFSLGRADDATWRGDGNVLDDYRRKFPLFRQAWEGEDWKKRWRKSPALKKMQNAYKGFLSRSTYRTPPGSRLESEG